MRANGTLASALVISMASAGAPALAAEPPTDAPTGWNYLPELLPLGGRGIFRIVAGEPGAMSARQMQVATKQNVAIVTREASAPLTAATTLRWRWNVRTLPSKLPETSAESHDYISIAVKFENGRDLTYMWSDTLPAETGFHCPLPGWQHRETHVVIRSGAANLGQWLGEERPVLTDYATHIGGPPPTRIVEVWLIANSFIQKTQGAASFAEISVGDRDTGRVRVF